MLGWFANAIERGRDASRLESKTVPMELLRDASTDWIHHGIRKTDEQLASIAISHGYTVTESAKEEGRCIDDYGYLIEYIGPKGPEWWTGDHIPRDGPAEWSQDSLQAVRFRRKEDAEMVMVGVLGLKLPSPNVKAIEHNWYSP